MVEEDQSYYRFLKDDWKKLTPEAKLPLSDQQLKAIKALNDRISLQDVQDIYVPLVHLLIKKFRSFQDWQATKTNFLQLPEKRVPFVIGISGSVAVGKSTTARLLQVLLTNFFPELHSQLITTDGFLYPNAELKKRQILGRKGFPESYDMASLLDFMGSVKNGQAKIQVPLYSHQSYDIVPDQFEIVDNPDILIVEGINVLQLPSNQTIYISDFFDWSIYVDANPELIEKWFLERFGILLDTAFHNPNDYYYEFAQWPRERAFAEAKKVWQRVDLPNLDEFILPTRSRANLILHKVEHHTMDAVYLRKY
ncbi:type I pantothenate kinase [Pediococcus ethanolidurans]|uniref:type I pantothenate kinase n=1 Tax=Pediococcus ethanolidurans TaxID=319653 RepID=UPI001C1EAFFC|nr:type I pantothenate kinase [Pediococcus ethanolidurans]MBU7555466.1 type I pantothenate kinase [Pediococcus ethanolidurans]MBU7563820.1 type I pantothenate kinase [Pediococcus ethanolidurans]MCT4397438.1 type I pantothenate kinase [Pediococcus ethanolidurans]MCV3315232.1 type I pantothenate kinase [Pediococcus ethanolidurans]MCV3321460.1 type I pantothenate kinase [Pediococcus ethanolidurans]